MLSLVGCGGRSVEHVEDDGGTPLSVNPPDEKSAEESTIEACGELCDGCGIDALTKRSCDDFCGEITEQSTAAGCLALARDLFACRTKSSTGCSFTACPTQTNAFAVCTLDFCDATASPTALCRAW